MGMEFQRGRKSNIFIIAGMEISIWTIATCLFSFFPFQELMHYSSYRYWRDRMSCLIFLDPSETPCPKYYYVYPVRDMKVSWSVLKRQKDGPQQMGTLKRLTILPQSGVAISSVLCQDSY